MRALVVPSGIGVSHVHRCLLVAAALAGRGHEVLFAVRDDHRDRVEKAGFVALACDDVSVPATEDAYTSWTEDRIAAALDQLTALVMALGPDVVVADFHPIAAMAAERAGVVSVGLITAGLAPGAARLTGARGITLWAAERLLTLRAEKSLRPFDVVTRAQRLRPRNAYASLFAADATLTTELRSFVGPLERHVTFTGPLIWDDGGPPLPPPRTGTARIYVTLGNTGDPRLADVALEALAGRPGLELVMSTGHLLDPPAAPAGVTVARTLPGAEVMRQSRLVVHAGGIGTTYQALAAGVPMVVVPHIPGQELTARCVTRRGVGAGLRMQGLTADRLRAMCCRLVLDSSARDRAREFAAELAVTDGPRLAAMSVERAATAARSPRRRGARH